MVKHLPEREQKKALYYGIWGAFIFRVLALFSLNLIMSLGWVKMVGGLYLIYLAAKFFIMDQAATPPPKYLLFSFWRTVLMVEIIDIAFSLDSILAAVSITQNYFIVLSGAVFGILMMRFASYEFIKLVKKFPRLETTAYLLVCIVGLKLFIQGMNLTRVDFHDSHNIFFWGFWSSMIGALILGFRSESRQDILNAKAQVIKN